MKKETLLEIVQRIAEYIDAGTVNSITDTRESMQIAKIVSETYYDLLLRNEIAVEYNFYKPDSIVEPTTKPNYFKLKQPAITINSVRYKNETTDKYTELCYVTPEEFISSRINLSKTFNKDTNEPQWIDVTDFSGVEYRIQNNKHPSYYTILNDEYIVVDSFDLSVEDTIQESKVIIYGKFMPSFVLEDDFIPNINTIHFPTLLSMSKIAAGAELKEWMSPQEYNKARKQVIISNQLDKRIEGIGSTIWNNRSRDGRRNKSPSVHLQRLLH